RVVAVGFVVWGLMCAYQLLVLAPFLWLMGTREKMLARITAHERVGYGRDIEVMHRGAWNDRQTPSRFGIANVNGRFVVVQID
ncbi:MAG TPA: hypothetical protein VK427_22040, partial [Kofleriaceae bacterium]|nr:hypothetical protein [Kofleriaceae bacterium]